MQNEAILQDDKLKKITLTKYDSQLWTLVYGINVYVRSMECHTMIGVNIIILS